jgi:maltose O-acetyltransferase
MAAVKVLTIIWDGSIRLVGSALGVCLAVLLRRAWLYFPFVSEALSGLPFAVGWKVRQAVYERILPHIGRTAVLHYGVVLEDPRTEIGEDVWVGTGAYVDFAVVGDHVLIGPRAVLLAGGRHHRFDRLDVPIKLQGNPLKEPLLIGDGAWIGASATVMAPVGRNAIVGAGSVVTREVPPYAIVVGNPARILRMRDGSPSPVTVDSSRDPA